MTTSDDVVVAGAKLRALLAVLALHVGRVVPTEQLVDALWGERSAGGGAQRSAGARVEAAPGAGLGRPRRHARRRLRARAAAGSRSTCTGTSSSSPRAGRRPPTATRAARSTLLAEADALWRGEPLADFAYEDFAAAAITRLSELRLAVIEERLDLELAARSPPGSDRPARGARRRASAARAAPRAADARAVPRRPAGRRAADLPGGPSHPRRGARARTRATSSAGWSRRSSPRTRSLDAAGRRRSRPPIAAPSAARRIPEALTPLVGRDAELRDLARAARRASLRHARRAGRGRQDAARPGGRRAPAADGLSFGGCLVELAPVGDPAGVRAAIAAALDLPDPSRLAEMIGDREMLIVLDNCEHVITTAAEVAEDLLRRCPGLRLLATSREGLRVGGETIWPVPPLAADDAVRLFVARARAAGRAARALRRPARCRSPTSAPASTGCRSPSSWRPPAPGRSRSPRSPLG